MKKFYIQPNIQYQPMCIMEIICASGSTISVSGNTSLEMGGGAAPGTVIPM